MPAVIALAIRSLASMAITLGLTALAERYLLPVFNRAIQETMEFFGVGEETAKDIVANEWIQFMEQVGIATLVWKTKVPVKILDRLGFTSKGFVRRKVQALTKTKTPSTTSPSGPVVPATPETIQEIARSTAQARGLKFADVVSYAQIITGIVGVPILTYSVLINTIDFAAWPTSAYQSTYQKFFSWFGLNPDTPAASSKVLSEETWRRVLNFYKEVGVVGINDPFKGQSVLFTTQNLIDVVDKIAANITLEGKQASLKNIIGATQALMLRREGETIPSIGQGSTTTKTPAAPAGVKVFTGIVSQGKLGDATAFTPREDDLIDSIDDLRVGAQNNLAQFLVSLPGRIVYEIKIVSQITDANGFKRRGETRQVISSYLKDGTPRYKTVTNKFAICDVFVFTARNVRTKIQTIILGPTDAVAFQPGANDLQNLEVDLKNNITTREVAEVVPTAAEAVVKPKSEIITRFETLGLREFGLEKMPEIEARAADPGASFQVITAPFGSSGGFMPGDPSLMREITQKIESIKMLRAEGIKISFPNAARRLGVPEFAELDDPGRGGVSTRTSDDLNTQLRNAKTLSEWYSLQGKPLPSVAERGAIYEAFGLGQAVWYTGTAEQNIKLLAEHKSRSV